MTKARIVQSVPIAAVILGCWLGPAAAASPSVEQLLSGVAVGADGEPEGLVADDQVLAVSDEMREFLDVYVDRKANHYFKLNQLSYAIINDATFGLEYDETTRTAADTFAARRGNCLSFSNMYVAMARYVGLNARFQEVDIPPDWTFRDDAFVLNRHVNVVVSGGSAGYHVVDFNLDDFKTSYDQVAISDSRAKAHFYNNLGVERLHANDIEAAFAYFRRALIATENRFAPAWTNLGILYMRRDRPGFAEAAFVQALRWKPGDLVAMSNLVTYYEGTGNVDAAESYRKKVRYHRKRNPYYRFMVAREAFLEGDYDGALNNINYAIRKRPKEDQFYFLLGMIHLQQGNSNAARKWFDKAEKLAASDALKRNYSNKIDMLMSAAREN
ncbi:MAG: tetratricopeptide repeat protein [Holophagae bacterium]|jgi:Flp pilus assembly protein TadD